MKYVYLISSEDKDFNINYKIGISNDPNKRLSCLQTGNPNILKIIKIYKTKYASKIESYIHKLYSDNNILNEWFELSKNDIDCFIELCEKMDNIYKVLHEQNTYYQDRFLK